MAVVDGVGTRFVNFDEVGTFFGLLPEHGHKFIVGAGVIRVGEHVLRGIKAYGVFVAAQNIDGIAADAQTRPGNLAAVDGVADGGVGGTSAFRAHVAFGGEAGQQIIASGKRGHDGALRDGLLDSLQVFRTRMEEEMDVDVDQAGKQRGVAEVNDLGTLRMLDDGADFDDAIALHENFSGRDNFAGIDFEKTRGVEHDGSLRRCALRKERNGIESS